MKSTLAEYNIEKDATIMLGMKLGRGTDLELKVKLANNQEIAIKISTTNTVKELKETIYSVNKCLDVKNMKLEHASIPLSDNDA